MTTLRVQPATIAHDRVPIDALSPHPRNYRRHPDEQVARIAASLARFGQVRSIVVQSGAPGRYLTVAGHGVVTAARQLGWSDVAADIIPADWTADQVEGYLVADNEHARGADDDLAALAALLEGQEHAGYALESLGYDADGLAALLDDLADAHLGGADDGDGDTSDDDEDKTGEPLPADAPRIFSDEQVIDAAFAHFRATGFPYRRLPLYACMEDINRLAATRADALVHTTRGYHVADTYHPHRFHASANGMRSPLASYQSDKYLRLALDNYKRLVGYVPLDILGQLSEVHATQACSNFRPGFALHLYRRFCQPGAVVLDTSTGYGGRLVGFLASGFAGRYIGIDPNTETHAGNLRMAAELGYADAVELHNAPAEDVPHDVVRGRCDFAFTSPPYFAKEHYSDEPTQSWRRYSTGDAWRRGFLRPMLALQFAALKPGAHAVVNIADVSLRGRTYALERWTLEDGVAVGFEHVSTERFELTSRFGAGQPDEVATEPVLIFRKAGG